MSRFEAITNHGREIVAGGALLAAPLVATGCLPPTQPMMCSPEASGVTDDIASAGDSQYWTLQGGYLEPGTNKPVDGSEFTQEVIDELETCMGHTARIGATSESLRNLEAWDNPYADTSFTIILANDIKIDDETGLPNVPLRTPAADDPDPINNPNTTKNNLENYIDKIGANCNVLVNIPDTAWNYDPAYIAEANGLLEEIAANGTENTPASNIFVYNWNDVVAEHPEYVGTDQVHQTPAGIDAFGEGVKSELAMCEQHNQAFTDRGAAPVLDQMVDAVMQG